MRVLAIRTDRPEAEIMLMDGTAKPIAKTWYAHRQLSTTLHREIDELLRSQGKTLHDVQGIVCFEGPGSFTGLRIGLTVGNAVAYGLGIPIVGTRGEKWAQRGAEQLAAGANARVVLPHYGAAVHITPPRQI